MSDQNSISNFLDGMKGEIDASSEHIIESVVSRGVKNLTSKISKVETDYVVEETEKKPEEKKELKAPMGLADKAISTYKTKIKPPSEAGKDMESGEVPANEVPVTKAQRENLKAMARSLAGMRNPANSACEGSGSSYAATTMEEVEETAPVVESLEEYRSRVFGTFGLEEGKKKDDTYLETDFKKRQKNNEKARKDLMKGPQMKNPHFEEVDVVAQFEEALLDLTDRDWMSVDKVTRQIAEEHGILVKELNRDFRLAHGQYPDKWIKEQVEVEECGWMPLDEATRVNKFGMVYEVTFIFRGKSYRFKFFWPEMARPSKDDMQTAIGKFYPNAKVLAFYPSQDQGDNYMVMVPPVTEHYVAYGEDCWEEMSEEATETLNIIAEEVGEPIAAVERLEEGFAVLVADHDTGEEKLVTFQEGIFNLKKVSPEEKAKMSREKKMKELERLAKHASNPLSDINTKKKMAVKEDWQKVNRKDKTDGMSQKAVNAYKRENPGSKLQTAVTEKNPTGKRAGRRKSFCSRSNGQRKMHNIDCSKTPDKRICKARRRWKC